MAYDPLATYKQNLGRYLTTMGTIFRAPEMNVGENLGVTGKFGGQVYAADTTNPVTQGVQTPQLNVDTDKPTTSFGDLNNGNNNNGGNGGGGGGGGGGNAELDALLKIQAEGNLNPAQKTQLEEMMNKLRNGATSSSNDALTAALGVYDARKQGILNKIPSIESARDLRLKGLTQGLEDFNTTANQEEGKRINELGQAATGINETYTQASRQTRASAKTLAQKLRAMFSGAGTLDSTQYRDMNLDQSKEFMQTIGDIGREKAGKVTANTQEQEDIKQYYASQRLSQQKAIELQKETVKSEADAAIQGALDDANLSDAQKVEAVTAANEKLQTRLGELDVMETNLKTQAEKDSQDLAIKMAELSGKGYSDTYKQSADNRAALSAMSAVLEKYRNEDGTLALSDEGIKSVARSVGYPEDDAVNFFGVQVKKKNSGSGQAGYDENLGLTL